jgi:hypothetical protein
LSVPEELGALTLRSGGVLNEPPGDGFMRIPHPYNAGTIFRRLYLWRYGVDVIISHSAIIHVLWVIARGYDGQ